MHKLGRCVQLVKLHCELQCAVLGGQYGSAAGGGSSEDVAGAGRGINRVLQLWDYEGSLGRKVGHWPRHLVHPALLTSGRCVDVLLGWPHSM